MVFSTVGFGGVSGCGRVGAIFFAASSFAPNFSSFSCDDGERVVQAALRDPVPVIAVQVRQHNRIDGRQLGHRERRRLPPLGDQTVSEIGTLTLMEEVRVGEHRDATGRNQGRGVRRT